MHKNIPAWSPMIKIFPGTTAIKKKAVDVSVCLTDSKYLHKFKRYEI